MDIWPLNFQGSQESMKDHYSLHIGSKRKTTTGAILQNPNGQHEIRGIHSTELPFPDYISWYVKDRLAGKITCMVCGEEGHYTCDCPMKDREEKVICILCNRVGHCHLWCCRNNVSKNQACRRCGEKGHCTNKGLDEKYTKSNLSCSSCDISHPHGKCPMGKITCFLCEGEDHVPAQCHLSPVLTVITQVHRESFQAAVEQAMAEKSRRTVTIDKQSREIELYDNSRGCLFKVNRDMPPKVSGLNHGEQANCDRESPVKSKVHVCEKVTTVAREVEPLTLVPRVTCFNCNYEGHYANQCPKKPQLGELEQYNVTCSNFQANRCRKKTPGALELCDITCFNCNDKGHYARNCSKPPRELVTYGDNHGYQSKGGSGVAPDVSSFSYGAQDQCDNMSPIRRQIPASENTNSEDTTDVELTPVLRFRVTCFNCHDDGHYASMCPKERAPRKLGRGNITCLNCNGKHYTINCHKRKKPGELKLCDVTCLSCHDKGHFANRCPKKQLRQLEP